MAPLAVACMHDGLRGASSAATSRSCASPKAGDARVDDDAGGDAAAADIRAHDAISPASPAGSSRAFEVLVRVPSCPAGCAAPPVLLPLPLLSPPSR